ECGAAAATAAARHAAAGRAQGPHARPGQSHWPADPAGQPVDRVPEGLLSGGAPALRQTDTTGGPRLPARLPYSRTGASCQRGAGADRAARRPLSLERTEGSTLLGPPPRTALSGQPGAGAGQSTLCARAGGSTGGPAPAAGGLRPSDWAALPPA